MVILETVVLAAADDGGMRGILFVLVVIAVLLLIAGATIALMTFFNVRKAQALQPEAAQLEAQNI
jgi:flagellar basal body-associated protein FliL